MKVLNDLLWDGKLKIYQNDDSFKFSLDSILLAKFVTINDSTKNILDIGCGNAPISLMLTKRTKASILGVELQEESYLLAKESIKYNNCENQITIELGDIKDKCLTLENNYYDTIVCNPPYYKNDMVKSNNENKIIARSESNLNLDDLFKIAKKLLKDKGNIALVIDSNRLEDVIIAMKSNKIELKKLQFVYPKISKNSNIVLIEGTKNGKIGLKVLEPIIIQNNEDKYTDYIVKILTEFEK